MIDKLRYWCHVTLYTRVWIEILPNHVALTNWRSPSTRGCGLKCTCSYRRKSCRSSPSTRGCGLKSIACCIAMFWQKSPSTRGCGLKLEEVHKAGFENASPSTRGCGLKYRENRYNDVYCHVTLYTRVWIEI